MPYIFMGESSSQYVTTLKSLVNIGILIVKMKNVSSKHVSYEYLDNHSVREKCRNLKNVHFEKKYPKIKKPIFPLRERSHIT